MSKPNAPTDVDLLAMATESGAAHGARLLRLPAMGLEIAALRAGKSTRADTFCLGILESERIDASRWADLADPMCAAWLAAAKAAVS